MSDNDDLIAQERGAIERMRVNLTPKTQAALRRAARRQGDTLTDTVNRAIQYYDLAIEGVTPRTPVPKGFWRQVFWRLGRRPRT